MLKPAVIAVLAAGILILAGPAPAADAPPPAPTPDYHPSLGDLMTMAVQPRHTKIGIASRAGNWTYLAYESSELRNAFARVARTIPVYRQNKLADLFAAGVLPAIDSLDLAIKAKDKDKVEAAYGQVTEACNACHASLDHAFVVIRAPRESPYADQDFQGR